jgi:hypothetical protein
MKLLIRDDDTCGFTTVEELERCYHDIWQEIPVCLSITPFRIPGCVDYVPKEFYGRTDPLPLENNKDLVDFIHEGIKKNILDIALHGYHHFRELSDNESKEIEKLDPRIIGREYYTGKNLEIKTAHGKKYLESLLNCKVNTFVPPSNRISKEGIKAIEMNHLNLVSAPSLWRFNERPFHLYNYFNATKRFSWRIRTGKSHYPFVIDCKTHKEVEYYTLYPDSDVNILKKELDFCHDVNGIFILSLHYHEFQKSLVSGETLKSALNEFIDYIYGKTNVERVSYRDLW